jgi:hypothetical protein
MFIDPFFELDPKTYVKLTISDSVIGLPEELLLYGTLAASGVFITFEGTEGDNLRYRKDGGDPSATDGHEILLGDIIVEIGRTALAQMKFIKTGTEDVTAHCTGYF